MCPLGVSTLFPCSEISSATPGVSVLMLEVKEGNEGQKYTVTQTGFHLASHFHLCQKQLLLSDYWKTEGRWVQSDVLFTSNKAWVSY